jgi:hypothetical protein
MILKVNAFSEGTNWSNSKYRARSWKTNSAQSYKTERHDTSAYIWSWCQQVSDGFCGWSSNWTGNI